LNYLSYIFRFRPNSTTFGHKTETDKSNINLEKICHADGEIYLNFLNISNISEKIHIKILNISVSTEPVKDPI